MNKTIFNFNRQGRIWSFIFPAFLFIILSITLVSAFGYDSSNSFGYNSLATASAGTGTINNYYNNYTNTTIVEGYNATYAAGMPYWYNHTLTIEDTYGQWFYNMSKPLEDVFGKYWYNMSDGSYNASYEQCINNASYLSTFNSTYDIWAYNQTYSGSTFNSTYNAGINATFNQSLTDILYSPITSSSPYTQYNITTADKTTINFTKWDTEAGQNVITIQIGANHNANIECVLWSNSSAAAVGVQYNITFIGAGVPTIHSWDIEEFTAVTPTRTTTYCGAGAGFAGTRSCDVIPTSSSAGYSPTYLHGFVLNGASATIMQIRMKSEVAGRVATLKSSWCKSIEG